jgi:hypothetical protein
LERLGAEADPVESSLSHGFEFGDIDRAWVSFACNFTIGDWWVRIEDRLQNIGDLSGGKKRRSAPADKDRFSWATGEA